MTITEYNPYNEGKDHINIYSRSKTKLGVSLSNFALSPFVHPIHGLFNSVEGFYYWLSTGKSNDELRKLYGFRAKEEGKKYKVLPIENFDQQIAEAIEYKIEQNQYIKDELINSDLPFTHYYCYGDFDNYKIVKSKTGDWLVSIIEEIRNKLKRD